MPYWRLSAFYLFYFASLGALLPYWGLYLQSLGFDSVAIGSLMAILMVTKVVAPNLWGWLGDHLGHRMRIVQLASLLALLAFPGIFFVNGFWGIALVMAFYSFFWNASLPQFEAVTLNYLGSRAERYARIRVWGSVGFILTVVGMGHWVDRAGPDAVAWGVLATFAGVLLASLMVKDLPNHRPHEAQPPLASLLARRDVAAFLLAVFLMQMSHGPYYAFYTIYLQDLGYTKTTIGVLWGLGVAAEVMLFLFMHRLLRRFDTRSILMTSLALAGLRWVFIGWFPEILPVLAISQLLHAASFGSFHASAIHMIHGYFKGVHQGRGQALYASISFGAGGAAGTFISGFMWAHWGATFAYTLASLVALAGAGIVWRYVTENRG